MSTNQAPEVSRAAGVSHTSLFGLPVFVQVGVERYVGQITETSIHIICKGKKCLCVQEMNTPCARK